MNLPETYNITVDPLDRRALPRPEIIQFTARYDYLLALAHTDHFIFHCPIWKDEGSLIKAAMGE
jgi:hypothetical protein